MALIETIVDDLGTVMAELVFGHDKYLLPDGSEMIIAAVPAWCRRCAKFTVVEAMKTPEELEAECRSYYEKWTTRPLVPPHQEYHDRLMHEARQWKIALSARRSPARCLECAGNDFVAIPEDGKWIAHPGAAGRRVRKDIERISLAQMIRSGRLFDTEGQRISEFSRSCRSKHE